MARHKRDPVDTLRTKVWCAVVLLTSGRQAQAVERLVYPEHCRKQPEGWYQPNAFNKYKRGDRTPLDDGMNSAIGRVDLMFPGTARVFRSSLWLAMQEPHVTWLHIQEWLERTATSEAKETWEKSASEAGRLELLGDSHIDALGCQLLRIRLVRAECPSHAKTLVWSSQHWIEKHLKTEVSLPFAEELLELLRKRVSALGSLRSPPCARPEDLRNPNRPMYTYVRYG